MSKPSRKENTFRRRPAFKPTRESFLILCEGESTEPHYFNSFRLTSATVRTLPVTAGDAMAVVRAAIKRQQTETDNGKEYDHYWVIFDKDATSNATFNQAIALAESYGFHVAYSNQAFELWFLLHFDYVSGPLHRNQYAGRLTKRLGFPYSKQADVARLLYKALYSRQTTAIDNARRLYDQFAGELSGKGHDPATEESSTTVYVLVEQLRAFQ